MDIGWSSPTTTALLAKLYSPGEATTQATTNPDSGAGKTPPATTPTPAQQTAATAPPAYPVNNQGNYADPGHPPNNDPNAHWFWSNMAHQWVSNNYSYDANGKALTPDQVAKFKGDDLQRAQNKLAAWRPGHAAATGGPGVDVPIYNAETKTYSYKDKDGKWTHNVAVGDIYNLLSDTVKKDYPEWYFGQYATQQDQGHRSSLDSQAFDNQTFATRGGQTTRYAATSF